MDFAPYIDPMNCAHARMYPDAEYWEQAIDKEMKSLKDKGVLCIEDPPRHRKVDIIDSKEVLKRKVLANGELWISTNFVSLLEVVSRHLASVTTTLSHLLVSFDRFASCLRWRFLSALMYSISMSGLLSSTRR